jgi:hypothetical protein
MDLRLHLAPARTRTVWRDISLDAATAAGGLLLGATLRDPTGATTSYATARCTQYATVALSESEVSRGAAACAA